MSNTPSFPAGMRPIGPPRPDPQVSNATGRNNKRRVVPQKPDEPYHKLFEEAIRRRPTEAVGFAFAFGLVAALILRRPSC